MSIETLNKKMEFIGGSYLDSEAVPVEGVTLTIKGLNKDKVEDMQTHKKKDFFILSFEETKWQMLLSAKTQRKQIIRIMGSQSAKDWFGKKICVYKDTTRRYGPEKHYAMRFRSV